MNVEAKVDSFCDKYKFLLTSAPKGLVDTNQELLTVGLCNVAGSCVQSMPTSGAFTRYAISKACGLRTPLANLYSGKNQIYFKLHIKSMYIFLLLGVIVLLALSYLSPYFNFIPEATLAAILICSIFTLLDFKLPWRLWHESKRDFIVWLVCFVVCIVSGVEVGLFVSIIINVLHLLYLWARPEIAVKIQEVCMTRHDTKTLLSSYSSSSPLSLSSCCLFSMTKQIDDMQYICVTPGNAIYFPAINHLRDKVLKATAQAKQRIPVVIDCHKISGLDFTAAQGFVKLAGGLRHDTAEPDVALDSTSCQSDNDADGFAGDTLLILYRMQVHLQKLIDNAENLVFCESEEKIREFLTQESLRNGFINLKEHIRASIDLGYKIEIE